MGILLVLALAGLTLAVASQAGKAKSAATAPSVTADQIQQLSTYTGLPPALVPTFLAAAQSGDPNVAYATAASLRAQGYAQAADLLTQGADVLLGKKPAGTPSSPSAAMTPVPPTPAMTTPQAPTPAHDPPMGTDLKTTVENVLRQTNDPATINRVADMLQANGFPNTAAELRRRASEIAAAQVDPISIIEDILHKADQGQPPIIPPAAIPPVATVPPVGPPTSVPGTGLPAGSAPAAPLMPTAPSVPNASPAPTPPVPPAPQSPTSPPTTTGVRFYVVEPNDNPSLIAKKFTGDPSRWRELAQANPEANLASAFIHPGQRLRVPADWPNAPEAGPVIHRPPAVSPVTPSGTYDPNRARDLAGRLLADVANKGAGYDHELAREFQRAAGLAPDGDYGPRTAGAVEYFTNTSAPPSLPQYGTGKKPYTPPRAAA